MSAQEDLIQNEPASSPAPGRRVRVSTLGANVLVALGLGAVAVGGLFSAAPHVSWKLHQIGLQAAGFGVAFDVVCAMGVTLFAAGLVVRAVARVSRQNDRLADVQVDLTLALDQLAADIADVRAGVDQLLIVPEEESAAETVAGHNEKDALYRMAASLDQLGGRLTKRISAELGAVKDGFHELQTGVTRIAERVELLETAPAAPAPVAPVAQAPRVEASMLGQEAPATFEPEPVEALDEPEDEEDSAVMIDLDAEETPIELLDRLTEEVEGAAGGPTINLYDPAPAMPGRPEPGKQAKPKTYESSLDRLLPEDRVRDALDESR